MMETERFILRHWQESDADALFKYASDPEVGPRAGWPPHKSVEESLEIIRTIFSGEGMWAVIWKETNEAIGCVGYLSSTASNLKIAETECEVGFWIARPYWGKGICTEAMKLVVDYCINVKGFYHPLGRLLSRQSVIGPRDGKMRVRRYRQRNFMRKPCGRFRPTCEGNETGSKPQNN
jgi:Acetyltransferases, including N-acetylases of ribosomal proteins